MKIGMTGGEVIGNRGEENEKVVSVSSVMKITAAVDLFKPGYQCGYICTYVYTDTYINMCVCTCVTIT